MPRSPSRASWALVHERYIANPFPGGTGPVATAADPRARGRLNPGPRRIDPGPGDASTPARSTTEQESHS